MAILDRNNSSAPDGSSNTTNSSGPRSANTANTAVARNTRPSVARDADENPSHGRDSPGSGETFWLTGALFYLLLLIRDIMTFLIRGGLGAMMFAMDQVLRAVLLVVQGVFGSTVSSILSYPCRLVMWLYQLLLWIVYIMVELLLYLPRPILYLYVIVLSLLMVFGPSFIPNMSLTVFHSLHHFISLYKWLYRLLAGSDPLVDHAGH